MPIDSQGIMNGENMTASGVESTPFCVTPSMSTKCFNYAPAATPSDIGGESLSAKLGSSVLIGVALANNLF